MSQEKEIKPLQTFALANAYEMGESLVQKRALILTLRKVQSVSLLHSNSHLHSKRTHSVAYENRFQLKPETC